MSALTHALPPSGVSTSADRLIEAVQALSLSRTLPDVMSVVRTAARHLLGADGATFILREGSHCFYADEDAIGPLWKGKRFPIASCVSGWAMFHRQSVAIEDIYADPRIPADLYRPTFVKSLVVVPIRTASPIGAIGTYWASRRSFLPEELRLLEALANSTSIAMENVELIGTLEQRVQERTAELARLNQELESFSYSVSHDLRAPLRAIDGFGLILQEDAGEKLDEHAKAHLARIRAATGQMGRLIDALLLLARYSRTPMSRELCNLSRIGREVVDTLRQAEPHRAVQVRIQEGLVAYADATLLRVVLTNLLGNAWKFTRKRAVGQIELGVGQSEGRPHFFVRDNGSGFDMAYASKLFGPFQRLHQVGEFEGTGIGLATVARIILRHQGRIWADAAPEQGATFSFELGAPEAPPATA